jgi:hypothetical protein
MGQNDPKRVEKVHKSTKNARKIVGFSALNGHKCSKNKNLEGFL